MPNREVDPGSVPADIRARAAKLTEVDPSSVPPEVRLKAEKMRMAAEAAMTPEQRYERWVGKLPGWAQTVAPGTMGEAGFMAGAAADVGLGLAGVPLPPPVSLGLPLATAGIGGALEDPQNRLGNAGWEVAKGAGQELLGGLGNQALKFAGRFLGKSGMLEHTAERVGKSIPDMFHKFPLKDVPTTAKEIEDAFAGNKTIDAAGKQLDRWGDTLEKRLGKYEPGTPAKLVPPSSGVAAHYTPEIAPKGTPFLMPDIASDGTMVMRHMGLKEAITHVRELQAAGTTATGVVKRSGAAPMTANIAAQARQALTDQLNQLHPGLGADYRGLSSDYGLARQLQKTFAGGFREDRALNQPKLLQAARTNAQRIDQLKPGVGQQLREAIAPLGEAAKPESLPGVRMHGGESGLRALFHFPVPYKPETPDILPFYAKLLAKNPQLRPLMGALGYQAATAGSKDQGD